MKNRVRSHSSPFQLRLPKVGRVYMKRYTASMLAVVFMLSASGQRGFNYYKDPGKVGSKNPKAFVYFKKAYYDYIWTWSRSGADSAEYYLKLAIQEDSLYEAAYAFLGHVYQFKTYDLVDVENKLALQKKNAEKAMSFHPKTGDAYSLMADVKWHERDTLQALSLLRKAIEMEPDHVGNYIWLAVRFSQIPNGKDSAIYYLHKLLALDPEYGQAYMKLANLYLAYNNLDSAKYYYWKTIDHYNQIKPRDNRMMAGYYGLASTLLKERKIDSAIYYYRMYVNELAPSDFLPKDMGLWMTYKGLFECCKAMVKSNRPMGGYWSGRRIQSHQPDILLPFAVWGLTGAQYSLSAWAVPTASLPIHFISFTSTAYFITELLDKPSKRSALPSII
jgi:tetratricopeptide (TPR) repeat protein